MSVLLVGVIPASVIGLKEAGQRATAAELARSAVEKARRDGFGQVKAQSLPPVFANGTEYRTEVELGPAMTSSGPMDPARGTEVKVTVRWTTTRGEPKVYVARYTVVKQI